MGTWGIGLYQNDVASDLKADFADWVRLPWPRDRLVRELASHIGVDLDATSLDADQTAFWLVIADQFHAYGIEDEEVFARAHALIADGTDLRLMEELEMSPADLRNRAQALDALASKWLQPPKRKKTIRPLTPEPLLLQAGDLIAYPTMHWNARYKPITADDIKNYRFEPDATNVFVVLATQHVFHGYFARYFIAPLLMFHSDGVPTVEDCMICYFICECHIPEKTFNAVGGWADITKRDLSFIEGSKIGSIALNGAKVTEHFPALERERGEHNYTKLGYLHMQHSIWNNRVRVSAWGAYGDELESFVVGS